MENACYAAMETLYTVNIQQHIYKIYPVSMHVFPAYGISVYNINELLYFVQSLYSIVLKCTVNIFIRINIFFIYVFFSIQLLDRTLK